MIIIYSQPRGGALSQTIKPRESSTPTKGLMGGMGTPQGPAGAEEIMASRNYTTVQKQNCFLDFTIHHSYLNLPQALVTTSGGDFWTRTAQAPLKVRRSSPNSS